MILANLNRSTLILWLFLISHLVIKLVAVPTLSIWGDEAFSIFYCQQSIVELTNRLAADTNAPLYFYILHFWIKLFGISELAVKSLSIIFSAGTAFFIYRIGQRVQGIQTAIMASFLFLLSNLHFDFSHEVRGYSLICMEVCLSFYLFIKYIQSNRASLLIYLTIVNALIVYTHYIAFFAPVIQFISIWIFRLNKRQNWQLTASYAGSFLLFCPYILVLINNLPDENFWLPKPGLFELNYVILKLVGNDLAFWYVFIPFSISPFLLSKKIRSRLFRPEFKFGLLIVFLMWFFAPIFLDYFLAQWIPVFRLRYVLFSSIGIYIGLAYIIWNLRLSIMMRYIISAAYVVLFVFEFNPENRSPEDWKETAKFLKMGNTDSSAALVCAGYKIRDLAYYYDRAAFIDYNNMYKRLEANNLFAIKTEKDLELINGLNQFKKLTIVLSHNLSTDPDRLIESYFNVSKYNKCDEYNAGVSIDLLVYRPLHLPCELLSKKNSGTVSLNCYSWYKTQFLDEVSLSKVTEYELNIELSRNCNSDGPEYKIEGMKTPGYLINKSSEFSPTFKTELRGEIKIKYSVKLSGEKSNKSSFVLVVESDEKIEHVSIHELNGLINNTSTNQFSYSTMLPHNLPENCTLKVYVWNPGVESVVLSGLSIQLWDSFQ